MVINDHVQAIQMWGNKNMKMPNKKPRKIDHSLVHLQCSIVECTPLTRTRCILSFKTVTNEKYRKFFMFHIKLSIHFLGSQIQRRNKSEKWTNLSYKHMTCDWAMQFPFYSNTISIKIRCKFAASWTWSLRDCQNKIQYERFNPIKYKCQKPESLFKSYTLNTSVGIHCHTTFCILLAAAEYSKGLSRLQKEKRKTTFS